MMAEQQQTAHKTTKRTRKRVWLVVTTGILVATIVLAYLLLSRPSVEQQLAAIEAARAIPDSQNAAVIYYQILDDYPMTAANNPFWTTRSTWTLFEPSFSFIDSGAPEWFNSHQGAIQMLQRASKKEKCRLSLNLDPDMSFKHECILDAMQQWKYLLLFAAHIEITEGRIDAALEKLLRLIQMAKHLYQQPKMADWYAGAHHESEALRHFARLIVRGHPKETHLTTIENALPQIHNNWEQDWPKIRKVEELYEDHQKKQAGICRLLLDILRIGKKRSRATRRSADYQYFHDAYLRMISRRRGLRILIAMRRYKNQTGHWPHSLDDVVTLAPPEAFTDPISEGGFVYKQSERVAGGFVLYSKGKNNIDENGPMDHRNAMPDHTRLEKDDILIWLPSAW